MIFFWSIILLYVFYWIFIINKIAIFCKGVVLMNSMNIVFFQICTQIPKITTNFDNIFLKFS